MSEIVGLVEGGPPFARNERAVVVVRDVADADLAFSFRDRSTERFIGLDGWSGEPVFHPGRRVTLPDGRTGYSVGSEVTQHLRLSGAFRIETPTGLGAEIVSRVATFYPTRADVGIAFDAPPPPEPPRMPADRPSLDRGPASPSVNPFPPTEPTPSRPAPPAPAPAPLPEPPVALQPPPRPEPPPPPLPLPQPLSPPDPQPTLQPLPAAPPPAPVPEPPQSIQPLPAPEPLPDSSPEPLPPPEPEPAAETDPAPLPLPELLPAPLPPPEPLPIPPAPPVALPPPAATTNRKIVWIALALLLVAGAAVAYVLKLNADADEALFQRAVTCYRQEGACGAPGCFAEYQRTYPTGRHAADVVAILGRAQSECRPFNRPQPPPPQPQPQPTTSYYYIGNLRNTNGDDDWLALRSEPRRDRLNYDVAFSRANMRNGTLLIYLGQQNDFYKVRLLTGQEGWASSQFILCCRSR